MMPLPLGAFPRRFPCADKKSVVLRLGVYTYDDLSAIGEIIFQFNVAFSIGVLT
jgi:hypothetical protein